MPPPTKPARAFSRILFAGAAALASAGAQEAKPPRGVPAECRQLVTAVAKDWGSTSGRLRCWERERAGAPWQPAVFAQAVPVLVGKNGLAWGRGVLPVEDSRVAAKREGDGKAPAGLFRLGRVFGYAAALPEGADYPYLQVTRWDAWVDDPAHPLYNRHVRVDPGQAPPWFPEHRMRLGDFAYEWLVEIRHNADPPVAPFGSAIFFHIRRGPARPSHGCTTMRRDHLLALIRWLREPPAPHYLLLPRPAYQERAAAWDLPPLDPPGEGQ